MEIGDRVKVQATNDFPSYAEPEYEGMRGKVLVFDDSKEDETWVFVKLDDFEFGRWFYYGDLEEE